MSSQLISSARWGRVLGVWLKLQIYPGSAWKRQVHTAENPEAFLVERLLTEICILILHCKSELNRPIVAALDDPTDLEAWTSIHVVVVPNGRSRNVDSAETC